MVDTSGSFRVIKSDGGLFWLDCGGSVITAKARSRLKKDACLVGDFAFLEKDAPEPVIASVAPRRNRLIRPSVANIDSIIVMVAAVPKADRLLIDKLIINATKQDIEVVLCFNKSDISTEDYPELVQEYQHAVQKIVCISAANGDINELTSLLSGKLTCIAGQSAVGKSTFVNVLLGSLSQRTGDLSKKIQRGKNTTTASEIFPVCGGYIVDTPGFSIVDVVSIPPEDINHYYHDFDVHRQSCKFSTCTHTTEPDCSVRTAVKSGKISQNRYDRYLKIYAENKQLFDRNVKLRSTKK